MADIKTLRDWIAIATKDFVSAKKLAAPEVQEAIAAPRPSVPHEQVATEWELERAALALRQI